MQESAGYDVWRGQAQDATPQLAAPTIPGHMQSYQQAEGIPLLLITPEGFAARISPGAIQLTEIETRFVWC